MKQHRILQQKEKCTDRQNRSSQFTSIKYVTTFFYMLIIHQEILCLNFKQKRKIKLLCTVKRVCGVPKQNAVIYKAGVYLSEAQKPRPPLTHCIRVYSILIRTGKGGGGGRVEPERRLEGQQFTKLVENTNMTDDTISSLQTLINT